MTQPSKERMFRAEILNQQLERLQDYLQRVNKQAGEVLALKDAINHVDTIQEHDELLVPLAAGVFLKAQAVATNEVLVNVGNGVVVPKSISGMHQMLDEQLSEMRSYEHELQQQFEATLNELKSIEKEFEGS